MHTSDDQIMLNGTFLQFSVDCVFDMGGEMSEHALYEEILLILCF